MKRIAVVPFRLTHERKFQVGDERVVALEEREVDLDAFSDTRIGNMVWHAVAVGRIRQATLEFRQVVLRPRVLNVGQSCPRVRTRCRRRRSTSRVDRIAAG